MKNLKLSFQNKAGENLNANLDFPLSGRPKAFALFAHCFTCNKDLTAARNIAKALNQQGFAVMRFDFTGLGNSEGEFADTNFSSNVHDLVEAAEYLAREYEAPKLLIGHSLGGAAVLFAAKEIASVQAVATIGAPACTTHVTHLFQSSLDEINENGYANLKLEGRDFTIKKQFVDDLNEHNMEETVKGLRKALLILHSPQDNVVGVDNAAKIYGFAKHPKSYVSLDKADHLLSKAVDSTYVGGVIAGWATRYLTLKEEKPLTTKQQVVTRLSELGFTTDIQSGDHYLIADEPLKVGGKDLGPSPYDLLLAAVGACTAMTIRMYASRKKWELDNVEVHLDHKKDYAQDCADCEKSDQKIDIINRYVQLEGNLDAEQRQKLLEIAEKCPVHKTLHSTVKVDTELVEN